MSDTENVTLFRGLKTLNLVNWFNRSIITLKISFVLHNNLLDEKCELNAKPYNFLPPYRKC